MRTRSRLWVGSAALTALVACGCGHTGGGRAPGLERDVGLGGGAIPSSFQARAPVEASRELLPLPPGRQVRPAKAQPAPVIETAPAELLPATHTRGDDGAITIGRGDWELTGQAVTRARQATLARPRQAVALEPALSVRSEGRGGSEPGPSRPPAYAHAADYSWLVGILVAGAGPDSWAVRYASTEQQDRHGGRLELVGTGMMAGFNSGQRVRVEGELVDPAPLQIQPAYRVRAIQRLQAP